MPALEWSQPLYDLAMEHSIDMAEGRVPFGHDGFQDRFQKASQSLRIMNFAENVA